MHMSRAVFYNVADLQVLIFSQMVRCLDILEDYLRAKGWVACGLVACVMLLSL